MEESVLLSRPAPPNRRRTASVSSRPRASSTGSGVSRSSSTFSSATNSPPPPVPYRRPSRVIPADLVRMDTDPQSEPRKDNQEIYPLSPSPDEPVSREYLLDTTRTMLDRKTEEINSVGRLGHLLCAQQNQMLSHIASMEDLAAQLPSQGNYHSSSSQASLERVTEAVRQKLQHLATLQKQWQAENANAYPFQGLNGEDLHGSKGMVLSSTRNDLASCRRNSTQSAGSRISSQDDRSINTDFAAEVSESLLQEVRRLQALLTERDELLKQNKLDAENSEKNNEELREVLKKNDERLESYKEANWNLELTAQDLQGKLSDITSNQARLEADRARINRTLRSTQETLENMKHEKEALQHSSESAKTRLENELVTFRKAKAKLEREKAELTSENESMKSQLSKSSKMFRNFSGTTLVPSPPDGKIENLIEATWEPKSAKSMRSITQDTIHLDQYPSEDEDSDEKIPWSPEDDGEQKYNQLKADLARSRKELLKLRQLFVNQPTSGAHRLSQLQEKQGQTSDDDEAENYYATDESPEAVQNPRRRSIRGRGGPLRARARYRQTGNHVISVTQASLGGPLNSVFNDKENNTPSSVIVNETPRQEESMEMLGSPVGNNQDSPNPFNYDESPDAYAARMGLRELAINKVDAINHQVKRVPSQSSLYKDNRPRSGMFSTAPRDVIRNSYTDDSYSQSPLSRMHQMQPQVSKAEVGLQVAVEQVQTEDTATQTLAVSEPQEHLGKIASNASIQVDDESEEETGLIGGESMSENHESQSTASDTVKESTEVLEVHEQNEMSGRLSEHTETADIATRHPFAAALSVSNFFSPNQEHQNRVSAATISTSSVNNPAPYSLPGSTASGISIGNFDSDNVDWTDDSDMDLVSYQDDSDVSQESDYEEQSEYPRNFKSFITAREATSSENCHTENEHTPHNESIDTNLREEIAASQRLMYDLEYDSPLKDMQSDPKVSQIHEKNDEEIRLEKRSHCDIDGFDRPSTPPIESNVFIDDEVHESNEEDAELSKRTTLRPRRSAMVGQPLQEEKPLNRTRSMTISNTRVGSPFQKFGSGRAGALSPTGSMRYKPPRPPSPPPPELLRRAQTPTITVQSDRLAVPSSPMALSPYRRGSSSMAPPASTTPRRGTISSPGNRLVRSPAMGGFGAVDTDSIAHQRANHSMTPTPKKRMGARFSSDIQSVALGSVLSVDSQDILGDNAEENAAVGNLVRSAAQPRLSGLGIDFKQSVTDPMIVQALTQVMIGEYMYKYVRNKVTKGISERRHQRFFWLHPYNKTLYWRTSDPSTTTTSQASSKSVYIEGIRQVVDHNAHPPRQYHMGIVVETKDRSIKLTAPTRERHEMWFNSINYLLSTNPTRAETPIDSTPTEIQRPTTPASLLPFRESDRTQQSTPGGSFLGRKKSISRAKSFLSNKRSNTPTAGNGEYIVESGRSQGRRRRLSGNNVYDTSAELVEHDDADAEANGYIEDGGMQRKEDEGHFCNDENRFDGMENVRVCCDGEHTLHDITNSSHRLNHNSEMRKRTFDGSIRSKKTRKRRNSVNEDQQSPSVAAEKRRKAWERNAASRSRSTTSLGNTLVRTPTNLSVPINRHGAGLVL